MVKGDFVVGRSSSFAPAEEEEEEQQQQQQQEQQQKMKKKHKRSGSGCVRYSARLNRNDFPSK